MSECRSCGAEIVWADIDGKRIPLNKRRERAYRQKGVELGGEIMEMREVVGGKTQPMLLYRSHFLTCPQASQHSKGKP